MHTIEQEANQELDRYLELCHEFGPGLSMFSPRVDAVWHQRLSDRHQYLESCRALDIAPIGHISAGAATAPAGTEWVAEYERRWGHLSDVWFMDEIDTVNEDERSKYMASRSHKAIATGCCQDTSWIPESCCQDTSWNPEPCCQDTSTSPA